MAKKTPYEVWTAEIEAMWRAYLGEGIYEGTARLAAQKVQLATLKARLPLEEAAIAIGERVFGEAKKAA